ncbi:MAG: response regulator [Gemmataceae bacterium]|nr:response regulator [Gemmataceae bacterium]
METTSRLRILCVDDNQDVADSEAALLQIVGFDARACYDAPGALAAAREFRPDVCLIDLHMPDMNGDKLVAHLREQTGGRPVLFVAVTAMSNEEARHLTEAAGFLLHLVKPVDPHDLLRIVDDLWRLRETASRTGVPAVRPESG